MPEITRESIFVEAFHEDLGAPRSALTQQSSINH